MEKILAIVEGQTEAHFVKATYANALITRPFPNGEDVAVEVIVDAVTDTVETVCGHISKVLVLLDLEKRSVSANDFLNAILSALSQNCSGRQFYIGVADRQIETWILADVHTMRQRFDPEYVYPGDGCGAKKLLHKLSEGIVRAPRDTANLLKSCSAERALSNSPSLRALIDQIDFEWVWAKN
jgi:hypothetical protein